MDYFYKHESELFTFYRVPKVLFTEEPFKNMNCEAKLLYGLLLDKMSASVKNQWLDEENKAYVIYQITDIMEDMNISKKKAIASLKELEEVGLVEKKLKGLGQPSLLYVKKFRIVNDEVPYGNC